MRKELIVTAKTIDEAVKEAATALGVDVATLQYKVTREPKKGLFGIGAVAAEVTAWVEVVEESAPVEKKTRAPRAPKKKKESEPTPVVPVAELTLTPVADTTPYEPAITLLTTILADFGIEGEVKLSTAAEDEGTIYGELVGEGVEALIGHHGETLDALQYLCNLRLRGEDENGGKLKLDIANYRAKREETLQKLAVRKAEQALKYGKSVTLEPMNPYERRIIHAAVQGIEGVTTVSTGTQNGRRVVIYPEGTTPDLAAPRGRRR